MWGRVFDPARSSEARLVFPAVSTDPPSSARLDRVEDPVPQVCASHVRYFLKCSQPCGTNSCLIPLYPEPDLPPARHHANLPNRNSRDPGRNLLPSRRGKQQFVVFPAVQGKPKINLRLLPHHRHRNSVASISAPTPLSSQMWPRSVESPSLMSIIAEASPFSRRKRPTSIRGIGWKWLGKSRRSNFLSAGEQINRGGGSAQLASHVNPVTRTRARTQHCLALRHRAQHRRCRPARRRAIEQCRRLPDSL